MPNLQLWPLLESLTIKTKEAEILRLREDAPFAWAQRAFVKQIEDQYNADLPVRIIVLKGRQLGLSTLTEAVLFIWCFLHEGTNALVLSKEKSDSEYLFSMTKRYWDEGPFKGLVPTKYDRQGYIEWAGINSTFTTDTAKKADVGRGHTYQAVHCSEVAFWPSADEIVASLNEAIPYSHGTIVVYESTANGVGGFFHDEWMKAIDPEGDKSTFTPMFFPWWEHSEYEVKGANLKYGDLDEEERDLLEVYPKLTLPKLAWRRRKLTTYSNPEIFKQEYPCSMEEAFLSTGTNLFPLVKLAQCYKPDVPVEQGYLYNDGGKLAWMDDRKGHTWVYKRPDPRQIRKYVVAVDPTWTLEGDPACIQVLDRVSLEQVAVWHGSADPEKVGEIALALAIWYGADTILNTEIQGGGKSVIRVWKEAQWQNIWLDRRPDKPRGVMQAYGFYSTFEQKNLLIGTMQSALHRRSLIIHHPATYYELTHYIVHEDGEKGPARRSGHDDCVISLCIALYTAMSESGSLDFKTMMAPPPLHIPGQTPPRIANIGKEVEPMDLTRFGPRQMVPDDPSIDEWYAI